MDELTLSRLAHNETLFRAINEQVLGLEARFGSQEGAFICECADTSCSEKLFLPLDEYRRIHADNRRFFVVPGHERTEVETVAEQHERYLVVEKTLDP